MGICGWMIDDTCQLGVLLGLFFPVLGACVADLIWLFDQDYIGQQKAEFWTQWFLITLAVRRAVVS